MRQDLIYVTIKDIQETLIKYHDRTGKYCTFTAALNELYHIGHFCLKPTSFPDYGKWDISNPDMLWDLFCESQIEIGRILRNPGTFSSFVSEDYIGFMVRDIIANLHVHGENAVFHAHDYFEINYVLKGSLDIQINMESKTLQKGDFLIIAPQISHSIKASDNAVAVVIALRKTTFQNVFFNILRNEDLLSEFFKNCLYSFRQNYLLFRIPTDSYVCEIIRQIFKESNSREKCSNEFACSYMSILFGMILRTYSSTYLLHSDKQSVISQMPAILTYIKNNYKTLTLSRLSAFFGYDTNYLGKQIHKATGLYYNDIITKLKLEEAVQWLTYSDESIEKIAEFSGYNSLQHFSRAFKKWSGVSPSAFRKMGQTEPHPFSQ